MPTHGLLHSPQSVLVFLFVSSWYASMYIVYSDNIKLPERRILLRQIQEWFEGKCEVTELWEKSYKFKNDLMQVYILVACSENLNTFTLNLWEN